MTRLLGLKSSALHSCFLDSRRSKHVSKREITTWWQVFGGIRQATHCKT
jgi:hypothetical protein